MNARLSLRQLLAETQGRFIVPSFQRRYRWGEEATDKQNPVTLLLEGIGEAKSRGTDHFVHSIQLRRNDSTGAYEIINGQQRITCLYLLLKALGSDAPFHLDYEARPKAKAWLMSRFGDCTASNLDEDTCDIYHFKKSLEAIDAYFARATEQEKAEFADYALDHVHTLAITADEKADPVATFGLMNATKESMQAADIIKADILRLASDPAQPHATPRDLYNQRHRYAQEWEKCALWWNQSDVRQYYSTSADSPMSLMLMLCLRNYGDDCTQPLTYTEFASAIAQSDAKPYHAAKHFLLRMRRIQKRFDDAYADAETYNRIQAILLLQSEQARYDFLWMYFAQMSISKQELVRYYKLSFLGMTIEEIRNGESWTERFEELHAALAMADVYHTEAKRDVFNLLLRLNIDEDIKLGRRFDFSIWNNRSLEHIYSKSKVWHVADDRNCYDGNDTRLPYRAQRLSDDKTMMPRTEIVNADGMQLSEHCIGNLVLLYGQNNADFGNADFEHKKMMFLTPGDLGAFKSRNLLHSVCVFAGKEWNAQSIVANYNLTLKNLKLYYGNH